MLHVDDQERGPARLEAMQVLDPLEFGLAEIFNAIHSRRRGEKRRAGLSPAASPETSNENLLLTALRGSLPSHPKSSTDAARQTYAIKFKHGEQQSLPFCTGQYTATITEALSPASHQFW
jgi:hypothetical protein